MAAPRLDDTIREQRPEAREILLAVQGLVDRRKVRDAQAKADMLERNRLLSTARDLDPPVSWADMARIVEVSDVSIMGAVKTHHANAVG